MHHRPFATKVSLSPGTGKHTFCLPREFVSGPSRPERLTMAVLKPLPQSRQNNARAASSACSSLVAVRCSILSGLLSHLRFLVISISPRLSRNYKRSRLKQMSLKQPEILVAEAARFWIHEPRVAKVWVESPDQSTARSNHEVIK